jgi:flavin-binding protein dodecin
MVAMADSVYRVTELVETASQTLRDLRIAEVIELDLQIEDGRVRAYRTRLKVSFKYERGQA